jgi:1-acyl-sn-glycerol-3-phosphate acyltransferase
MDGLLVLRRYLDEDLAPARDPAVGVREGRVVVELFDPIPTDGKTEADIPELMARVRDALLS